MTNLTKLRKERNLTTREMSVIFQVSKSTYNNWETGKSEPSIEKIKQLALFFNVTTDYLLEFSPSVNASIITEKELEIIKVYRLANEEGRNAIELTAKAFAKTTPFTSKSSNNVINVKT
ncbi:MAG TPA: hypothetical protein DEV87_04820 [Clostridiales bacterium]|nr:hypothetical protein [Clostridiales bacterium]